MIARVRIGRDDLLAWVRRDHACALTDDELALRILDWLAANATGGLRVGSYPPDGSTFLGDRSKPAPLAQFELDSSCMPGLYGFMREVG